MLRPYKFGGGPGKGFSAFWKQKRILPEQNPLSSIFASLLPYFINSSYAVAAFTCDSAAATSFKSGTTGMS